MPTYGRYTVEVRLFDLVYIWTRYRYIVLWRFITCTHNCTKLNSIHCLPCKCYGIYSTNTTGIHIQNVGGSYNHRSSPGLQGSLRAPPPLNNRRLREELRTLPNLPDSDYFRKGSQCHSTSAARKFKYPGHVYILHWRQSVLILQSLDRLLMFLKLRFMFVVVFVFVFSWLRLSQVNF